MGGRTLDPRLTCLHSGGVPWPTSSRVNLERRKGTTSWACSVANIDRCSQGSQRSRGPGDWDVNPCGARARPGWLLQSQSTVDGGAIVASSSPQGPWEAADRSDPPSWPARLGGCSWPSACAPSEVSWPPGWRRLRPIPHPDAALRCVRVWARSILPNQHGVAWIFCKLSIDFKISPEVLPTPVSRVFSECDRIKCCAPPPCLPSLPIAIRVLPHAQSLPFPLRSPRSRPGRATSGQYDGESRERISPSLACPGYFHGIVSNHQGGRIHFRQGYVHQTF